MDGAGVGTLQEARDEWLRLSPGHQNVVREQQRDVLAAAPADRANALAAAAHRLGRYCYSTIPVAVAREALIKVARQCRLSSLEAATIIDVGLESGSRAPVGQPVLYAGRPA